jgi:hypothetical protein
VYVIAERIGDSSVEDKLEIDFVSNTNELTTLITHAISDESYRTMRSENAYQTFKERFPFGKQMMRAIFPKINYIVATYSGRINSRKDEDKMGTVLSYNIESLYQILVAKKECGIPNLISVITIICPRCKPEHEPAYENYYQIDKWRSQFAELGVSIETPKYFGGNITHSYDQWIQGMQSQPEVDYHLVIEDDYFVNPNELDFDFSLVRQFQRKFRDNIGYLATLAGTNQHEYHAMISNGLISNETLSRIPNILETFYTNFAQIQNSQLTFSLLFTLGISSNSVRDYSDEFEILFWNSTTKQLEDYTKTKSSRHLFLPFQVKLV